MFLKIVMKDINGESIQNKEPEAVIKNVVIKSRYFVPVGPEGKRTEEVDMIESLNNQEKAEFRILKENGVWKLLIKKARLIGLYRAAQELKSYKDIIKEKLNKIKEDFDDKKPQVSYSTQASTNLFSSCSR